MKPEYYMQRCLQLARLGSGYTAPNPMVGAVLVHEGRIIGEGYHKKYGEAHAEVNCINSVKEKELIPSSVLYVSLEPCAHFGKTPPCADLIIENRIRKVVIGCRDPFKEVDGKGIEKLKAAGVEVVLGVLESECKELNRRFFIFHTEHRPYIILKWAQTGDGFMALPSPKGGIREDSIRQRLHISNEYSNRFVHQWRSEESSILIGTNTALYDNPELITRLWPGPSPVRLVVDMNLRLPSSLKVFNGDARTIVFNKIRHETSENVSFYQVTEDVSLVHQVCNALYQLKIQSVLIEGGAKLLQSFIDEGIWDEARIICNEQLTTGKGLAAPTLSNAIKVSEQQFLHDKIGIFRNQRD